MTWLRGSVGQHVRSLRRARGLTQDRLAVASGLSPDTIRRLEGGAFSPSLDTLVKLTNGLQLSLSTLFGSLELNEHDDRDLLVELIRSRRPEEVVAITRVIQTLVHEFEDLRCGLSSTNSPGAGLDSLASTAAINRTNSRTGG